MSNSVVDQALDILVAGQDFTALRRALFATVAGHYLESESSAASPPDQENYKVFALNALLARLPTCSLAAITTITKGKTGIKDAVPGPFPLVVTAEARGSSDHFDFEGPGVMIPMVSSTGHGDASLKRVHFQDGQYAVGSILAVVQPKDTQQLSARYLHAYLSTFKDELLVSRMVGTANVSLTVAKIGDVPVPLLPISAQRKVDELMALCDRLEAQQANAESAHAQLVQALLNSLIQANDATEFAANWQRLAEHFHTLFTTEPSIDALKQTLLQLAMMGKLVPQDPNDEPASALIERIEKEKLTDKSKKHKSLNQIGLNGKLVALPTDWEWVCLGDVVEVTSSKRINVSDYVSEGVPFFRSKEIGELSKGKDISTDIFISSDRYEALKEMSGFPHKNDLMLTSVGSIGNTWLCDDRDFYYKDGNITKLRGRSTLNMRYVQLFIASSLFMRQVIDTISGTAYSALTIIKLNGINFPLAPIPEQHRIVAKVDQLMALCDQLKTRLTQARQLNEQLASTLVEQAVA